MTLRDLLIDAWDADPDADPDDIARMVIATARTRKDLADLVFPAVAAQATFVRRGIVRREESTAFSQPDHDAQTSGDEPVDPTDARRTLLELNTYVDHDTGYVPWGDLTVDQHEARIDFLERKMWGINVTVDRHRLAVKLIKNEGVSCLNDLPSIPDEFWEGMA